MQGFQFYLLKFFPLSKRIFEGFELVVFLKGLILYFIKGLILYFIKGLILYFVQQRLIATFKAKVP